MNGLTTTDFYMKFYCNDSIDLMDRITNSLEPKVIVNYFKKLNCRDYEKLLERVKKLMGRNDEKQLWSISITT